MSIIHCVSKKVPTFKLKILYTLQQCKNFENRLRFDKVTHSLKAGTFFEAQCSSGFQGIELSAFAIPSGQVPAYHYH